MGDSWLTDRCAELCTCKAGGVITCKDHSCKSNSVCALDDDGELSCKPTSKSTAMNSFNGNITPCCVCEVVCDVETLKT